MAIFGVGVYFLSIIWLITLMLCWVSVRTGHYVGIVSIGISFFVTVILVSLPKGEVQYSYSANFYDKLFVPRYVILSFLLMSVIAASIYGFIHVCLAPIETRKIRTIGGVN